MANPSLIHLSQILNGIELYTSVETIKTDLETVKEYTNGLSSDYTIENIKTEINNLETKINEINNKSFNDYIKITGILNPDGTITYNDLSDLIISITEDDYDIYDENGNIVYTDNGNRAKVNSGDLFVLINNELPGIEDPNEDDGFITATEPINIKVFILGEVKFSNLQSNYLIDNSERDLIIASKTATLIADELINNVEFKSALEEIINNEISDSLVTVNENINNIDNRVTILEQQVNNIHQYVEF